jgi:hypothetical protein
VQAREVIGELDELRVVDRLGHLGYRSIAPPARAVLVFPQRFQQILFAVVGEPRHVVPPGKVGAMADIAVVLLTSASALRPRRVPRISRRFGRRLFRN